MEVLALAGCAMRRLNAENILRDVFLEGQWNRAGDGMFSGIPPDLYRIRSARRCAMRTATSKPKVRI